jgi:hypothetical protein
MFGAVPLPTIRISLTVHLELVYVIWFEVSLDGPAHKLTSNHMTYTSAKSTVNEILMMGRGTALTCKGSFFSQNKFEKLMRLLVLL